MLQIQYVKTIRQFLPIIILLFLFSCKKESSPAITGNWYNSGFYTDPSQGGQGWEYYAGGMREWTTFKTDGHFAIRVDVPAHVGTYMYNRASGELKLNFTETDAAGNIRVVATDNRQVEFISADKLITSTTTSTGVNIKVEYTRED